MESNQEISVSDFEVDECLGMGSYGSVYSVKSRITGEYFAMKVSKYKSLKKEAGYISFLQKINTCLSLNFIEKKGININW